MDVTSLIFKIRHFWFHAYYFGVEEHEKMLRIMYKEKMNIDTSKFEVFSAEADKMLKKTKISYDSGIYKVEGHIDFLKDMDLVKEYQKDGSSTFGLTREGLQLAHQIKSEQQRRWTNIILSGGIILVSALTLAVQFI